MATFLFWILVALGPSMAAVAWFAWYSNALESPGPERKRVLD